MPLKSSPVLTLLLALSTVPVLFFYNGLQAQILSDPPFPINEENGGDTSKVAPNGETTVIYDSSSRVDDSTLADSLILDPILYKPDQDSLLVDVYVTDDSVISGSSPTLIMFKSVVFPGWGQFSNKKYIKAGAVFLLESYLIYESIYFAGKASDWRKKWKAAPDSLKSLYFDKYSLNRDRRNSNIWYTGVVIFLSMFDAYVDAHLRGFPEKRTRQNGLSLEFETGKTTLLSMHYNF